MSRRARRARQMDDALELFLDTISNMFGGVVFVAIMVAVLLQFGGGAEAYDPARVEALRREVANLETAARLSAPAPTDPASADAAERFARLEARQASLISEQRRQARLLDEARVQLTEAQRRVEESAAELAALDAERQRVDATIESLRRPSATRLRLPRFRPSGKTEVPILVEAGRAAALFRYGPAGERLEPNDAQVAVSEAGRARLKDGAGREVDPASPLQGPLGPVLARFDPEQTYVALAVWPDSFRHAAAIRDALVERGFDYNLIFVGEDQAVATGAAGGVQ